MQEIISENIQECEILKYICASSSNITLPGSNSSNGHNNIKLPIHENTTYNRLIKQSLNYLKNDQTDVVILHDPCMSILYFT